MPDCCTFKAVVSTEQTENLKKKYGKIPENTMKECDCEGVVMSDLTAYCKDYCCCDLSIKDISPERPPFERQQEIDKTIASFVKLQAELFRVVQVLKTSCILASALVRDFCVSWFVGVSCILFATLYQRPLSHFT